MSSSGALRSDRDASSEAMLLPATLSERESRLATIAATTPRDAFHGPYVQPSLPTTNRLLPEELALLIHNRNQYVGGPLTLERRAANPTWNTSALAANIPLLVPNNAYYTNTNGINGGSSFPRIYP
jgi:hypothetical protein